MLVSLVVGVMVSQQQPDISRGRSVLRRAEYESAGHQWMQPKPSLTYKITKPGLHLTRAVHFSAAAAML